MQEFFQEGLCFECNRCSDCCRISPGVVYLSQSDLTSLCQWFNLEEEVFISQFCRWIPYYEGKEALSLLEKKNYDCIFWENGCKAYGARPVQCSTYPFWSWILKDRSTWDSEAKECPGINKGRKWSGDEISTQKKLYEDNKPITR